MQNLKFRLKDRLENIAYAALRDMLDIGYVAYTNRKVTGKLHRTIGEYNSYSYYSKILFYKYKVCVSIIHLLK